MTKFKKSLWRPSLIAFLTFSLAFSSLGTGFAKLAYAQEVAPMSEPVVAAPLGDLNEVVNDFALPLPEITRPSHQPVVLEPVVEEPIIEEPVVDPILDPVVDVIDPLASVDSVKDDPIEELETLSEPPTDIFENKDEHRSPAEKLNIVDGSNTGAFGYNYPIDIPQGRSGLQPSLKLSYNNQDNNNLNIFGQGWSLGIPYVTRVAKRGANNLYDRNDFSYSLVGDLKPISLSDGIHGTYGPETDSGEYLKIEFKTDNSWLITSKDGVAYKFGQVASTRQDDPNDSSRIYKWMLEEVRDTNDNYIKYEYYKDGGQIYPDNIIYTGNGSTDGIFEVDFLRESRTDNLKSYTTGFQVANNYRINEIQIKIDGTWVTKYDFTYVAGHNGARSLLSSVRKTGKDANGLEVALPYQDFDYDQVIDGWLPNADIVLPEFFVGDGDDLGARFVDVNGDGLVDIVRSWDNIYDTDIKKVYINNGSDWTEDTNWTIPEFFISNGGSNYGVQLADVNGDGLVDIVRSWYDPYNTPIKKVYLNNGSGWTLDTNWTIPEYFGYIDYGARLVDVNGDGLVDIVRSWEYTYGDDIKKVYLNNGSGWTLDTNWTIPEFFTNDFHSNYGTELADVNGDGLVDIVRSCHDTTDTKKVYLNNGSGWIEDTSWVIPEFFGYQNYGIRLVDVNGDGLVDIVRSWDNTYGTDVKKVYINNGSGWTLDTNYTIPEFFTNDFGSDYSVRTADINGDGFEDMTKSETGNGSDIKRTYINNGQEELLSKVVDSQGGVIKVDYKPTTQQRDDQGNLLNPKIPYVMQTVEDINIDDGFNNTADISYKYEGGESKYIDPFDKRFAGFAKVEKTVGDTTTATYYHQGNDTNASQGEFADDYYKIGRPYRTEVYDNTNQTLLKQSITKWQDYDLGSSRKFVYDPLTSSTDFTGTTESAAVEKTYDFTTGNLIIESNLGKVQINTDTGQITDELTGDEKDTNYEYAQNTTKHILAAPKNKEISNTVETKDQDLYYDNLALGEVDKVNLTKEDYKYDNTEVRRNFNNFGLVNAEIDPKNATTTISYNAVNMYPASTTDALGNTIYTDYNLLNGQVSTSTDPNGAVTVNKSDALGRPIKALISDPTSPSQFITKQEISYYEGEPSVEGVFNELAVDGSTLSLWHMNGEAGTSAKKLNAQGNSSYDLVEYNNPLSSFGFNEADDGSYDLDRAVQGQDLEATTMTNGLSQMTTEFWVRPHVLRETADTMIGVWGLDVNQDHSWQISAVNSGKIKVWISADGIAKVQTDDLLYDKNIETAISTSTSEEVAEVMTSTENYWLSDSGVLTTGVWQYITMVYDGNSQEPIKVYVNGEQVDGTITGEIPSSLRSSEEPLRIGKWIDIDQVEYKLDGQVDEVRLSNSVRSASTISDYYNSRTSYTNMDPSYKETKDYFTTTNYTTSREYYDGLNRVIQKKSQMPTSGQYSTVDITYDSQGRVERQSLPYITTSLDYTVANQSQPAKIYTYDALSRVLTETTPVGTTSYDYDGFTTTITDANNHVKELTKDAYGNLVQVKEHNGASVYTTDYEYTLTNKLKKITDSAGNIRNFDYDALDNLNWQDMVHKPSVTTPAKIQYSYDKNGNVLTETSFKGDAISYVYDDLNRVLNEKLSDTDKITYTYDTGTYNKGRLVSANYNDGNYKIYNYDVLGRMTTATTTIYNEHFVLKYEYNLAGALSKVIYPNNYQVSYSFNSIGQVNSVSLDKGQGATTLVGNITYNQNGQMTHLERANGITTDYTYDPDQAFRLTRILSTTATSTLQDLNYTYDDVGNILTIADNANTDLQKSATYTYDDLNRLLTATVTYTNHSDKNYTQTFTYDSIGNMTSNSDLGTMNYANGQPHQLSSYGTRIFVYDTAGNMTRNGGITKFTWDWRSRLTNTFDVVSANNTYYGYDHNNQRFIKWTEDYVYVPPIIEEEQALRDLPAEPYIPEEGLSSDVPLLEEEAGLDSAGYWEWQVISKDEYIDKYYEKNLNDQTKSHIYLNDIKIATVNNSDQPYYLLTDHLSSSAILTDSTGTTAQLTDYKPYGNINYDNELVDLKDDYTFTGQEYDEESALQYFGARYNDNVLGKFISIDPLMIDILNAKKYNKDMVAILGNPQEFNSYAYAMNNPVVYVDPNGLWNQKTGEVEKGDTLNDITSQINDIYKTNYSYKDIASLNKIKDPDIIEIGQVIKPNEKVPDITADLSEKMHENVDDWKLFTPFYFRSKVKSGGDWDYKSKEGQYCTMSECGGKKYDSYIFLGEEVRYDAPSNINYGYVGTAQWYGTPDVLHHFAGTAHNQDNRSTSGDDPSDAYYINRGIFLYNSGY